jgi:hypothetical protein
MDHGITEYRDSPAVTIRWATPADARTLDVLAELDEAALPEAPVLLAFVDDELWVAMSLSTGALISDPFRRTAEVSALVVERGRQLTLPKRSRFALVRWGRSSAASRFSARAQPRW